MLNESEISQMAWVTVQPVHWQYLYAAVKLHTSLGTQTHNLPAETAHLASGVNGAQGLYVPTQNSVRDNVIGKKRIYLERYMRHRQSVGGLRR